MSKVINCRKKELIKLGYKDFQDAIGYDENVYIGRDMNFFVKGAKKSKWANPYTIKKYGLRGCLELYEKHVKERLIGEIDELEGKTLLCWCVEKPITEVREEIRCHGEILLKLVKKK